MKSSPAFNVVSVNLEARSYEIEIGAGILQSSAERILKLRTVSHAVLIADENTKQYATLIASSFNQRGVRTNLISVPPGEPSKSVQQTQVLWEQLLAIKADRKSVVVAVGGGVIGDLAGFIAASFARGLDFIQIPTTLLAHVDSSVGGKVGINLANAKNMVGHFWQPRLVLIDTDVLSTLPDRDFNSGMAEVIKYGMILDADFFDDLEQNISVIKDRDPSALAHIIGQSCRLKAKVVQEDERETTGQRAVLNYGHTFAHAFEATCGYGELLHGEAVSIGMLCASRLAEFLGRIPSDITQRQRQLLQAFDLPVDVPHSNTDDLLAVMQTDKKVEHGKLRFILPSRIGLVEMVSDVDESLVRKAIQEDS